MPDGSSHQETQPHAVNSLSAFYQEASPVLRKFQEARFPNFTELRKKANQVVSEVKNRFSNEPEEIVEEVLDLTLGFLRLDEDTLVKEGVKPSIDQRELSARLQHTFSDLIVKAGEGSDPELSSTMYDVMKNWQKLKNQRVFSQGSLPILWRGTESQIAIMRGLKNAGYNVRLPDYTQDQDDENNEVLEFDVKSGVDLMAEKDGILLLIDAKGRINQETVMLEETHEVDPAFEPNKLVRETALSFHPQKVIRTKLFVPSDTRSFMPLPAKWPENPDNPSEILNNFGRLRPHHEMSLVDQIDRIERVTNPIERKFA